VAFVALVATGIGIKLGQKSVLEPPEKPVKAEIGGKEVTFGTGPNGARLEISDKGLKVEAPGTKVEISDKGVEVKAPETHVAVGESTSAAADAGALAKPATEQAAAEAPGEPEDPARPGHKPGAKSGVHAASYKPAGNHRSKSGGGAVLPGFTPAGSYK
jgi:hypothetical protein